MFQNMTENGCQKTSKMRHKISLLSTSKMLQNMTKNGGQKTSKMRPKTSLGGGNKGSKTEKNTAKTLEGCSNPALANFTVFQATLIFVDGFTVLRLFGVLLGSKEHS